MFDDTSMTWRQCHMLVEGQMHKMGIDPEHCPEEGWKLCHRIAQAAYKAGLAVLSKPVAQIPNGDASNPQENPQ